MALLWADSFEHYGTGTNSTTWNNVRATMLAGAYAEISAEGYSYISVRETQARTGSRSLFIDVYDDITKWKVAFPLQQTVGVAFGLFLVTLPKENKDFILFFSKSSTGIVNIQIDTAGTILVVKGGSSGTVLGTSDAGVVTASAFNHIEVKVIRDNVVGEIEVRVNGVTVIKLTDLDLGTDDINEIYQWNVQNLSHTQMYLDDLIIWNGEGDVNNDFFGPARVLTVFADGEGTDNDWSVTGASTPHEAIDEIPPDDDTSYISSATVGDKQGLTLPALPPEVATIAGVLIPAYAKLGSAGTGNIKLSVASNSQVAAGPDTPLTTAYTYWPAIFEKDPNTDAQFDKAAFEAAEIIIEKTA